MFLKRSRFTRARKDGEESRTRSILAKLLALPASLVLVVSLLDHGAVAWDDRPAVEVGGAVDGGALTVDPTAVAPPDDGQVGHNVLPADQVSDPDAEATVALSDALGARFAGTWVDHESGRRHVAMVDAAPADLERARSGLTRDDAGLVGKGVVLVEATRSLAELEELKQAALKAADAAGVDYIIGVNVEENIVDGAIQADSWGKRGLAPLRTLAASSRGALALEFGEAQPLYSDTRVGDVRMITHLADGVSQTICTTGFGVMNPVYGEFMTSAGHCSWGQTGNTVYNSSGDDCCQTTAAGTVGLSHQTIDILAFSRDAEPKVWNGTEYPWVVGGANPQVNEPVCYRGATSGVEQCGTISHTNYTINIDLRGFSGPHYNYPGYCVSSASGIVGDGGDSGSAIYRYKEEEIQGVPTITAKGLIAAKFQFPGYTLTCGPTISQVLSVTSSQLLVK